MPQPKYNNKKETILVGFDTIEINLVNFSLLKGGDGNFYGYLTNGPRIALWGSQIY